MYSRLQKLSTLLGHRVRLEHEVVQDGEDKKEGFHVFVEDVNIFGDGVTFEDAILQVVDQAGVTFF